jgi:hypothetical protein
MLLIYGDESGWETLSDADRARVMKDYTDYTEELRSSGAMVAGDALQPTSNATTVRVRGDEQLVTDGPFAETKEQLGGYYLIEADSDEEALEWASEIPSAKLGTIEVRPVVVFPAPAPTS